MTDADYFPAEDFTRRCYEFRGCREQLARRSTHLLVLSL